MGKVKLSLEVIGDLRSLADNLQTVEDAVADGGGVEVERGAAESRNKGRSEKVAGDISGDRAKVPSPKQAPEEKTLVIEEVRVVLAKRSCSRHTEKVRELLAKHCADRMLEIALAEYVTLLGAVMGGFDSLLYALVVFVVMDYITGLMAAVEKQLSGEVCFKDIFKKVGIFCLVVIEYIVDTYIIRVGSNLRTAIIFCLFNESISILEKTIKMGFSISEKMKAVLELLWKKR